MSQKNYVFKNEQDFSFYILNAVAHDFIHDFNNYGRMGKILNYIMGLVDAIVPGTKKIPGLGTSQLSNSVNQLSELDEYDQAAASSAAASSAATSSAEPVYDDTPDSEDDTPDSEPQPTPVTGDIINLSPETVFTTAATANNPTAVIDTTNMYVSQIDDNFNDQDVSTLNPSVNVQLDRGTTDIIDIVNSNIAVYNTIAGKIPARTQISRDTTKKLNVMQKLKDFVQESKFLVISKFCSSARRASARTASSRGSYGGKKLLSQKGGNGLDVITQDIIVQSIKDIIAEIQVSEPENLQLISFFEFIMYSYLSLSIPNISPLEIFNNSSIEENATIFIVGKCNNNNIMEQAKLGLTALLQSSTPLSTPSSTQSSIPSYEKASGIPKLQKAMLLPPYRSSRVPISYLPGRFSGRDTSLSSGGGLNLTEYGQIPKETKDAFEKRIADLKAAPLYTWYSQCGGNNVDTNYETFYANYRSFMPVPTPGVTPTPVNAFITKIVGTQMMSVKRGIIENQHTNAQSGGRNQMKYYQQMLDAIVDLVFTKCIEVYEDIKNRSSASVVDAGDGSTITGSARLAVQKVSRLVARKVLQLTGLPLPSSSFNPSTVTSLSSQTDLNTELYILNNVAANDKGYTSVDDILIQYFLKYNGKSNIKSGQSALADLTGRINSRSCMKGGKTVCRVINNAVPSDTKAQIESFVVCPTSSVCDGMGAFGSCVKPAGKKEYSDMNFSISYPNAGGNSYYGQTNLKPNGSAVNINYGIVYGGLQIYNFIDILLDSQPIVLQANYVFKNLINRIIEIWKTSPSRDIDELWETLDDNQYFLSILKLGSQKAVGDIFQEINGTLENGGYFRTVSGLDSKNTYVLGGDRPSGVRVVKLLKDANSGKNPNSSGGYVGGQSSLIYFAPVSGGGKNKTKKNKTKNKRKNRKTKKNLKNKK